MYRVHVGYTRKGNDRWIKFATLEAANKFCGEVFDRLNVVLSIVKAGKP